MQQYCTQVIPNSTSLESTKKSGNNREEGVEKCPVKTAQIYYESNSQINFDNPDLTLLTSTRSNYDSGVAHVLRCLVSHHIHLGCKDLTKKYGERHYFRIADLAACALDDAIEIHLSSQPTSNKYQTDGRPLAIKIINSFDPNGGVSLKNWAIKLIKQYPDVYSFFLDRGLLLRTTWGIIKDTTPSSIRDSLQLSPFDLGIAQILIKYFQIVYRQGRIGAARNRCEPPTIIQLQEICTLLKQLSPDALLSELATLDQRNSQPLTNEELKRLCTTLGRLFPDDLSSELATLKRRKVNALTKKELQGLYTTLGRLSPYDLLSELTTIERRNSQPLTNEELQGICSILEKLSPDDLLSKLEGIGKQLRDYLLNKSTTPKNKDNFGKDVEIDRKYLELFKIAIEDVVGSIIDREHQRHLNRADGQPKNYLETLRLHFCEGMSLTDIGTYLDMRQDNVTRLIKLNNLREDICDRILKSQQEKISSDFYSDSYKYDKMRTDLINFIKNNKAIVAVAICQHISKKGK